MTAAPVNKMWCGNPDAHEAHFWGKWLQHFCRGKRNTKFALGGKPE